VQVGGGDGAALETGWERQFVVLDWCGGVAVVGEEFLFATTKGEAGGGSAAAVASVEERLFGHLATCSM
jgi:hypothetical protein